MYKSTSSNSQSRERRKAGSSTKNRYGLDANVFKNTDSPYDELVKEKKALETKASQLNAQMALAKRRYTFREPGQVSYETIARWESERANIRSRVTAIDKRLTEMKVDRRHQSQKDQESYVHVFHAVAKEMLASEVFRRLAVAAMHRCGEAMEEKAETASALTSAKEP